MCDFQERESKTFVKKLFWLGYYPGKLSDNYDLDTLPGAGPTDHVEF